MKKLMTFTYTLFVYLCVSPGISMSSEEEKIVFLNLKLVDGKVSLENMKIRNGKLKQPKKIKLYNNHIYYTVHDGADSKLFEGVIPDPSRTVYEFVDENGSLQSKTVIQDSVNFSVRIPYHPQIQEIKFNQIEEWSFWGWSFGKRTKNIGSLLINLKEITDEK